MKPVNSSRIGAKPWTSTYIAAPLRIALAGEHSTTPDGQRRAGLLDKSEIPS
ncbi:MAG: hypothetical protein WB992_10900 [Bryobacteraceae bacterium]